MQNVLLGGDDLEAYKLWKKLFSNKHLREHYAEKVKQKTSAGLDKISPKKFEEELEENIDIIIRKANNGTYKFTRYKQLLFNKGPNKFPRVVSIPTNRDKLTLSVLNELICGVYEESCKTALPQLIIDGIVQDIPYYNRYIKIDIRCFYSSIDHKLLVCTLKKKIRKKEILDLISKAIKTPTVSGLGKAIREAKENEKGLPEGLPISNSLANIFMEDIDRKYKSMNGIAYYRYVDDILILLNDDNFDMVYKLIKKDISKLDLKTNEKEDAGLISKGFLYLGYKINDRVVSVREESIYKIEHAIEDIVCKATENNLEYIQWRLNLRITGFILDGKKYGWMFFYSQITDESLLFRIDNTVNKILNRYNIADKIKVKRFVRTYKEITKALHKTKYIPNIDELTIEDKRYILSDIYRLDLSEKDDVGIEIMFRNIMKKEIRNIEKDIQNIS